MTELHFDAEKGIVTVVFSGPLKGPDAYQAVRDLVRHPEFRTGMSGIVDLRGIESVEIFGDEVRTGSQIVSRLGDAFAGSRWALVASSDAAYGVARQYGLQLAEEAFETRIFRELDTARAWIESPR